jgi:hypothetical protein
LRTGKAVVRKAPAKRKLAARKVSTVPVKKRFLPIASGILILISSIFAPFLVMAAWQNPGGNPPAGNAADPINTSALGQTKQGVLSVSFGTAQASPGFVVQDGRIGFGSSTPVVKLGVEAGVGTNAINIGGGRIVGLSEIPMNWDEAASRYYVDYRVGVATSTEGGWTTIGNNIYNSNSGFVGIGTTTPRSKLHVSVGGKAIVTSAVAQFTAGNSWSSTDGMVLIENPSTVQAATNRILKVSDGQATNGYLADFVSGGTSKFVIQSNGNVGIGTNAANVELSLYKGGAVSSRFHLQNGTSGVTSNDGFQVGIDGSANGYLWNYENTPLIFATNNTEKVRILAGGNVGIGTNNPAAYSYNSNAQLVVQGTTYSGVSIVANSANTSDVAFADGTAGTARYAGLIQYDHATDKMNFWTGGVQRNTFDASGNLGISSTTPTAAISVEGGAGSNKISLSDGRIVGLSEIPLNWNEAASRYYVDYRIGVATSTETGWAWSGNNIYNTNAGFVGIGTTTPDKLLTVVASPADNIAKFANRNSTAGSNFGVLVAAGSNSSDYSLSVRDRNYSSYYLYVRGDGNVGIGTNAPGARLSVAGNMDFTAASGQGVRFWASDQYKISMGNAAEYRYGPVSTDYSIKTNNSNTHGRGWTWGVSGATPNAALSVDGVFQLGSSSQMIANNILVGTTTSNYTPPSQSVVVDNAGGGVNVISVGTNRIIGLQEIPLNNNEAASKYYVDQSSGFGIPTPVGVSGYTLRSNGANWVSNNLLYNNGTNMAVGDATVYGDVRFNVSGSNGSNDSTFLTVKRDGTTNPVFAILPWDGQVYLSAGVYYSNGSWVHNSDDTNNNMLLMDPGVGTTWYASNNSLGSWNVASNISLWDDGARWKSSVQSTRAENSYFTGGNLGIGTTGPNEKIELYGASNAARLRITNTTNSRYTLIGHDAGGPFITAASAGDDVRINDSVGLIARFASSGSYFNAGNVGIGTTVAGNKLEIRQDINGTSYPLKLTNDDGNPLNISGVGMEFGRGPVWARVIGQQQTSNNYNYGQLLFQTRTSDVLGPETKMIIKSNGRVGIGTTDPSTYLDINGGTGEIADMSAGQINDVANADDSNDAINLGQADGRYAPIGSAMPAPGANGNTLRSNGTNWVAVSNLYNNGTNIGIGVTPDAKLDVSSTYAGGSGDYTNITGAQLKLRAGSGYIRVPHISVDANTSVVYNYQTGKNVYWGEDADTGNYIFRGRSVGIGITPGTGIKFHTYANANSGLISKQENANTGTSAYSEQQYHKGTYMTVVGMALDYANNEWDGGYIYASDGAGTVNPDMFVKAEGDLRFFAGGLTLASVRMTISSSTGQVYIPGELKLGGGDVAEYFHADKPYDKGTVLVLDDKGLKSVTACRVEYDKALIGVISDNAAVAMGQSKDENSVLIALTGVINVRVNDSNGPIEKGDLLTTSAVEGEAMRADRSETGAIIGKALENFTSGQGKISVLINLQ